MPGVDPGVARRPAEGERPAEFRHSMLENREEKGGTRC